RTGRGGKTLALFDEPMAAGVMRWGLCEASNASESRDAAEPPKKSQEVRDGKSCHGPASAFPISYLLRLLWRLRRVPGLARVARLTEAPAHDAGSHRLIEESQRLAAAPGA